MDYDAGDANEPVNNSLFSFNSMWSLGLDMASSSLCVSQAETRPITIIRFLLPHQVSVSA